MANRAPDGSGQSTSAGIGILPAEPPVAPKHPLTRVQHGLARTDDYAWLRDENWQQLMQDTSVLKPEIRAYLEAENAYAAAATADSAELRDRLFAEMRGRIKEDDSTVPATDGPFAYSMRFIEGGQHPMLVRTQRDGSEEAVLLDANKLAEGKAYFRLGSSDHSPDHRLLAYASDDKGSEYFALRIKDTATGVDLADIVTGTTGGAVWAADSRSLFYVWVDANHRPAKVFRHVLGTEQAADTVVYSEPDPGFFVSIGLTQSRAFIIISSHDHQTSEVRIIDAHRPETPPRLVAKRKVAEEYSLDHGNGRFYILTNANGAEDFKIVSAPEATPGRRYWKTIVPHRKGRLILHMSVLREFLVRLERENGLPRIVIRAMASGEEHTIAFDEEAYSLGIIDGYEFDTTNLRFSYSSMTTPSRVYDYDMATRTRVLRKEEEIPSGHNPDDYVTRRVFAPAADGETVPISLLYRKGTPLDGSAPCLLYGYGAYGVTIPASFGITRLSLVDRGFVYAIAHIRGGKDKGFHWYADGRRDRKINSFTDYIAAARHLASSGFTSPGRIVGWGGSAGGLVIGAVANMAPELFAGLIAEVPFVDVLDTMLDDTLPLTPPEWPEWGNPIASEADYRTILAYSPYDNIKPQPYPAILALAGLTDPRVTYWEPAKWVAKLRANKTDQRLLILKTNMDAGHGGAAGRFDRLKETAFATAFALTVV